ncbi:hypothetical protein [Streptomyces sp. NPDC006368]|uniref:hypothetical protein n=1 Tax=Streptomyces sp. NPDC006368 TaxID=3156760 RepID=UPI0033B175E8
MTRTKRLLGTTLMVMAVAAGVATPAPADSHAVSVPAGVRLADGVVVPLGDNHLPVEPRG